MKKSLLLCGLCATLVMGAVHAQELKPLSAEDKAKVEELLKAFDPNSFDIRFSYLDTSGKVQKSQVGKAKGLADLKQKNTVRVDKGEVARTNTNINIFKEARTNTNINIFKEARTNTNINIFKEGKLQDKAQELNNLLKKYYVEK